MSTGNNISNEKKYFSIGEVSELVGVKPSVLRFWEEEFIQLRPKKNKFGHRVYTEGDISIILKIKELLYEKGLTIRGAKAFLNEKSIVNNNVLLKEKLTNIKTFIRRIVNMRKNLELINKLENTGNSHVLHFYDELTQEEKDNLFEQISKIDFEEISKLYSNFKEGKKRIVENYKPASYFPYDEIYNNDELKNLSELVLKKGELAFLTVAGGQGSRLGYNHPKGCFPISPVKGKSLFQIFAEKIKFYSNYYKTNFYWYIMTSVDNHDETLAFFKRNNFFNLGKSNVHFFKQGNFPTLSMDGKLILKDKASIFFNPDGHGGILNALSKSGLYDHMLKNGIKYLSYFQVDNPLTKIVDPYFLGCHIKERSEISSKVIKKNKPEEKLGVICNKDGTNFIIEYSDLSKEDMYATDENGILKYLMGSIAIHILNVDFIINFTGRLPIHFAIKKVNGYDFSDIKNPVIKEMQGVKFESFIFDIIPMAKKAIFVETKREEEFAPLKNKEGEDSIETCKKAQSRLFYNWLKKAKFVNKEYEGENVEISPLFASDFQNFLIKANESYDKIIKTIYDGVKIKNEIYIE